MGQQLTKKFHKLPIPRAISSVRIRRNMITDKELRGALTCIQYIKDNHRWPGIFLNYGSNRPITAILSSIRRGDDDLMVYLKQQCTPRQCANALMEFLRKRPKPLLPTRVQELLIAENSCVATSIIANDALGLLQQDVKCKHLELLYGVFDLMNILVTLGSLRPTEISSSFAPHLIMPVLFKSSLQPALQNNWKNVTNIIYEMIMNFDRIKCRPSSITNA